MEKYKEISDLIKIDNFNRLLFFRGDRELEYLKNWLNESPVEIHVEIKDTAVNGISIKDLIKNCEKCGSVVERKYGVGSGKNSVMIILNSPRLVHKLEKQVFKNDSVDLLKKIIKATMLKFNECYITNLIKCETDDSLMQPSQMLDCCKDILKHELKLLNPDIVIVMGDIIPLQKIIHTSVNISWFNIDHPIVLLKNSDLKRSAWNTLKLVIKKLEELNSV